MIGSISGDCVDTFTESEGKFGIGGSRDPDASTVAECITACLADSDCTGFDFNTQDDSCWIHTSTDVFNNLQTDSSNVITNYQRVPCRK